MRVLLCYTQLRATIGASTDEAKRSRNAKSKQSKNSTEQSKTDMTLENGFRSKCCYAMVRVGARKTKSGQKVAIWICTRCRRRNVDIVQYTKDAPVPSTLFENSGSQFIVEDTEPPDTE